MRSLCNVDVPAVHDSDLANVGVSGADEKSTDAEESEDDIPWEYHRFISLDKTSPCAYCKL